MHSFSVVAVALLLGFGLALAPTAGAGEYHVYSCRTPAGAVAPTSGRSGSISVAADFDANSCASGGALMSALGTEGPHYADTDLVTWSFSAPPGETMLAATLWRAGDSLGGTAENATYMYALEAPNNVFDSADVFDDCVNSFGCVAAVGDTSQPLSSVNRVVVPAANLGSHLYVVASCQGAPGWQCTTSGADENGYEAVVYLYAADITLADNTPPTVSNVGGSLAAGGTLSGVGDISFSATDTGSGLYQAVFLVDGHVVSQQLLNSASGPCRNVGGTSDGSNAFFEVEPCPLALSDDLSFDTAL